MGLVHTQLRLSNPSKKELLPMDVEALVDSGASFLCVPKHIAFQLGLEELHKREVTVANNHKELCPYVGPVRVKFENRECMTGALVLGEKVLLGALPMEDMDVLIDPKNHRLMVNPESPNIQSAIVM